jgi:hypothetical protein
MNGLALLTILLVSTVPLYAQAQQPGTAKCKADAQKVVSSIRGDKAKSQTYCELDTLSGQIDQAAQQKDTKKVDALRRGPRFQRCSGHLMDVRSSRRDLCALVTQR